MKWYQITRSQSLISLKNRGDGKSHEIIESAVPQYIIYWQPNCGHVGTPWNGGRENDGGNICIENLEYNAVS